MYWLIVAAQNEKIAWDIPPHPASLSPSAEAAMVYFDFAALYSALAITRLFVILGPTSAEDRRLLMCLLTVLWDRRLAELGQLSRRFGKHSPESGLRALGALPEAAGIEGAVEHVRRANDTAEAAFARCEGVLNGLRRLLVLGMPVAAFYLITQVANLMATIGEWKSLRNAGSPDILPAAMQFSAECGLALAGLYWVYWMFRARLLRRRLDWRFFQDALMQPNLPAGRGDWSPE